MKKIIFITFAIFLTSFTEAQCPPQGTATSKRLQDLNVMKNRSVYPLNKAKDLSIYNVMDTGDDSNRFTDSQYVSIQAWVIYFKSGGSESCNCQSKDPTQWDIHIGIAPDSAADKKDCMIIEVTPASKKKLGIFIDKNFGNQIVHHYVRIWGFMFWDDEHKQNSTHTAKPGTRDIFRATGWEIHPVTDIQIIQ